MQQDYLFSPHRKRKNCWKIFEERVFLDSPKKIPLSVWRADTFVLNAPPMKYTSKIEVEPRHDARDLLALALFYAEVQLHSFVEYDQSTASLLQDVAAQGLEVLCPRRENPDVGDCEMFQQIPLDLRRRLPPVKGIGVPKLRENRLPECDGLTRGESPGSRVLLTQLLQLLDCGLSLGLAGGE